MRIIILPLALLSALTGQAHSGAWTQPEGSAQVIVTTAYSFAQDAFDDDGRPVAIVPFEKYELRGYAEYGLTDWATVIAQPELRFKQQGDEQSDGFGRFDLGVRTRLWRGDFSVVSVEGSVSAPGASDELAPLNGGDTDWELEARALFGRGVSIGWRHGFIDAQVGYRHRFDEPADEVLGDLTVGLDLTERSFAMLQSFNRLSVGSARAPFAKTQEHALAFSTVYRFGDVWSFQAGTKATAYGRNVLREQSFFVALWRKF